jgi:hypothetical protein
MPQKESPMPAVFQIVSRASGQALTCIASNPFSVYQMAVSDQVPAQFWTLQRQDSAEDFLLVSASSPGLVLGLPDGSAPGQPATLGLVSAETGQVWRISRIANPPYFFLLEADNDLLLDVPGGSHAVDQPVQAAPRTEHSNQQWTFVPVFSQF